jgi:branched-chain amino acid aminotransferase
MVSIDDLGILQGDGLFETMRAYNGNIFAIEEHMERLVRSARTIKMLNIPPEEELINACQSVVDANKLKSARVRLTVTRGPADGRKMTVIVTAEEYKEKPEDLACKGINAITLSGFRSSTDVLATVKSTSYQRLALARRIAGSAGCEEAILINEHGNISEGSYSNIFAVKGQEIITPPVTDGLLPGITRSLIMEIARKNDFKVKEQSIAAAQIPAMDEIFITNSLIEIMPVASVDGLKIEHKIGHTDDEKDEKADEAEDMPGGKLTFKLRKLYKDYVEKASRI